MVRCLRPSGAAGVGRVWGGGTEGSEAQKGGSGPPHSPPVLTTKGLVEALATLNPPKGDPGWGENGEGSVGVWAVYI